MDEVRAGAIGGIKKTFTFVIPTSTPITLSGDAFIRMTMTGEQGSYYSEEYELLPDGALTES